VTRGRMHDVDTYHGRASVPRLGQDETRNTLKER
jgi:hypothetical protein